MNLLLHLWFWSCWIPLGTGTAVTARTLLLFLAWNTLWVFNVCVLAGCPAKQTLQLGQCHALARTHIPSQAVGGCTRKPLCSNGNPPWCREEPWEGATSTSSYGETNSDQLQKQHQETPSQLCRRGHICTEVSAAQVLLCVQTLW